ncbi:hypothetical protein CTAYLR_001505 [Chrysophaeum taylorii]|uniref:AAA+ ATPase domain-containing protein n=1 Tax=Chrysophaeum taylorii TaxID=2483200 RepID=A0AAD7XLM0_9STRA|nr:hypothetical protein CTAYLR_001505 [Chrysophaeum taylorii]
MTTTSGFEKELESVVASHQAFIVRGATGSGKTWFVQKLTELLGDGNVVLIPQYPMFKPQLPVKTFINMLPLHTPAREQLFADLEAMGVPTNKRIGGKLMGMLDVPGLSGGQRKKMLLALAVQLAITRNAKAMVLDEPFAGIDAASMETVLAVLKEVQQFRSIKLFLVTHDHFRLIENAFVGTPHLNIDNRILQVGQSSNSGDTFTASRAITRQIKTLPKNEKPDAGSWIDTYVVKRHFIEGEHMLPTFTIIVFGILCGVMAGNYKGGGQSLELFCCRFVVPLCTCRGEGIEPFSSVFSFLKVFMLEYIHFGSILNYCFKRGQHLEDVGLLLTRKRDAIVETIVIAAIQSVTLGFLLNGLLIALAPRFWWINSNVIFVDVYYALQVQVAYTLLPVLQSNPVPNPLITMASIFPYVAVWGFANGTLLPRDMALKNARWLAFLSPMYHFGCADVKAANGELSLPGSNCKTTGIHLAFISPLLIFVIVAMAYVQIKHCIKTCRSNGPSEKNHGADVRIQDEGEEAA